MYGNNPGFKFKCKKCGKSFIKPRSKPAPGKKYTYCSRLCANLSTFKPRIKERSRHRGVNGYISCWAPKHPNAYCGRIREHVLKVEKRLGRYLRKGEVVHHKNYVQSDNRLKNLVVCKNSSRHHRLHKKTKFMVMEFIIENNLQDDLLKYISSRFNFNTELMK